MALKRRLFDAVLALARTRGVLKAGGRQRSDSTHVLGAMRAMTRLDGVDETLRHALDELATLAPEWLLAHTTPAWVDRCGLRAREFWLPKSTAGRQAWAARNGRRRDEPARGARGRRQDRRCCDGCRL